MPDHFEQLPEEIKEMIGTYLSDDGLRAVGTASTAMFNSAQQIIGTRLVRDCQTLLSKLDKMDHNLKELKKDLMARPGRIHGFHADLCLRFKKFHEKLWKALTKYLDANKRLTKQERDDPRNPTVVALLEKIENKIEALDKELKALEKL